MNLRLGPEAEAALRAESERSGRSQQDILREAVDRYLDLPSQRVAPVHDPLVARGAVLAPRSPYRRVQPTIVLPGPSRSLDLLDRDDRI